MEKKNNTKSILKYIVKTISMAALVVLVTIGLLLLFVFISTKVASKKGAVPPVNLYTIISPSMTPNINVYDVVVAVKTDPSKLKVGDVISFYTNEVNVNGLTITHRIYQIVEQDGGRYFKTKGDYNQYVDKWTVRENDIVGKVILKLPQLGRIQFFLGSRGGWLIAILIPALAIIAYDIYKIIKLILIRQKIISYQKEEDIKENNNSDLASVPDLYKTENNSDLASVPDLYKTENNSDLASAPDLYKTENNSDLSPVTDLHETESNFNSSQTLDLYGEKKEEIVNIDDNSKE